MPAGAFAQTTPAQAPAPAITTAAAEAPTETLIVTGSRIRRANLESTVPIVSVSGEEFFQTGAISVGDTLNELPQLRSTFSQQNSTRGLGTRGLNLLDLRGLGTQRTLVLVNRFMYRAKKGDVITAWYEKIINKISIINLSKNFKKEAKYNRDNE